MPTPREKFAEALRQLQKLQEEGKIAIYTNEIPSRVHKSLLIKNGFLKEVSNGWYIPISPEEKIGDTTSWYTSYWDFCAKFLHHKFGVEWCISPEQSLQLHAGNWSVPSQLIIRSPRSNNTPTSLPHHTSLFNLKAPIPETALIVTEKGIRMYSLAGSLIYSSPTIFLNNSLDSRTALSMIQDASELLPQLLEGGHSTIAGRLAGAFRNIGRERIADQIADTMKQAGYDIRENDPFNSKLNIDLSIRERSPFVNRLKLMWMEMREVVINSFPKAPGIQVDHKAYLQAVDEVYITDAYHSLSIERYKVTPELIDRVSSGQWNNKINEQDRQQKDAMAARGYYQAFLTVKETIIKILDGANPGKQVDIDHQNWYRQLFDPSIVAGLLKSSDLAGYRNHQVYIGGSKHVPLTVEAMRDVMPVFFELLEQEKEASVRAVLGHFVFVFIHPYMDGNGRIGRFLMNVMLASGGYPWTVIPVESRTEYMLALESASAEQNISLFANFIAHLVNEGSLGRPVAHLPVKP